MTLEQRLLRIVRDAFTDDTIVVSYEPFGKEWVVWSNAREAEIASSRMGMIDALVAALEVGP
jgi:hypothetical protein